MNQIKDLSIGLLFIFFVFILPIELIGRSLRISSNWSYLIYFIVLFSYFNRYEILNRIINISPKLFLQKEIYNFYTENYCRIDKRNPNFIPLTKIFIPTMINHKKSEILLMLNKRERFFNYMIIGNFLKIGPSVAINIGYKSPKNIKDALILLEENNFMKAHDDLEDFIETFRL